MRNRSSEERLVDRKPYGRDMFNCPFCKNPITNYDGSVAKDKPHWTVNPGSLLGDDIDDAQECNACGEHRPARDVRWPRHWNAPHVSDPLAL
jgi:hypothetical protein